MESSVHMYLGRYCLAATVLACAAVCAAEPQYQWKPGELYRFDYERSVVVRQPNETGQMTERTTVFSGVLIVEIRSVNAGVATALMRFDSPRIVLPPQLFFGAQQDAITEHADRSESVARAMVAAVKLARWTVTLHPSGAIRVDSRVPEKFPDWTRELSNLARWRNRQGELLAEILEQNAGLKVGAEDRDLLAVFSPPTEPEHVAAALRPQRSVRTGMEQHGKIPLTLQRGFASAAQNGYPIPGLLSRAAITMKPGNVSVTEGKGIFDARLGLLDTLAESYTVPVTYTQGAETLQQDVNVTYRLKRLAPAITTPE